jgi:uncharacterized BrkB/YihY/UPF0761 family membrane protein
VVGRFPRLQSCDRSYVSLLSMMPALAVVIGVLSYLFKKAENASVTRIQRAANIDFVVI